VRLNATPATGWLRRGEGPGGWWRELRPGEDADSQTRLIVGEHRLIFHRDLPWPGTDDAVHARHAMSGPPSSAWNVRFLVWPKCDIS
jgi:hypothetical protein